MFIEALCSINSGQADKGDILDVCEDVGNAMIRNGSGRKVSGSKKSAKKLVSPTKEQEKLIADREAAKATKAEDEAKAAEAAKLNAEAEERARAILDAMNRIVVEGNNLTRDGKPEVKAIEGVLGYDISAQERDDLMDKLEDKQKE